MANMKIAYCCINTELAKSGIRVNRGLTRKTLDSKGIEYLASLILQNLDDCATILKWNAENNINGYRFSSAMFPWMSEYVNIQSLPFFDQIANKLFQIGKIVKHYDFRVGFHPDHFNVLGSNNLDVVLKTVHELNMHGQILDGMDLPQTPYYGINIHISNTKPDKKSAIKRFVDNFSMLNYSVQKRLTVENDDKPNGYTVEDLQKTGLPIVFDNLHWQCNNGNDHFWSSYKMAKWSWPDGIRPLVHWSSSKREYEDKTAKYNAHADFIHEKIPFGGVDIEIEAKAKEQAVHKYKKDFCG